MANNRKKFREWNLITDSALLDEVERRINKGSIKIEHDSPNCYCVLKSKTGGGYLDLSTPLKPVNEIN